MSTPTHDTTTTYALPLPHPANEGADDCLRLRQAIQGVDAALKSVADYAETKADAIDVESGIVTALEGVNAAIALKADVATVNTELAKKSNAATMAAELAKKADKSQLAQKADVSALALKADKSTTDAALAENTSDHSALSITMTGIETRLDSAIAGLSTRVDGLEENMPKLVNLPTFDWPEKLPVNAPVPVTLRSASALAGIQIAAFLIRVGDNETVEIPAVNNMATYEVAAYGAVGAMFMVSAQARDGAGNLSAWNHLERPLGIAVVNAPEIIYPVENADVLIGGLTIIPSNFSASFNAIDTHISSDYKITSDEAGSTIISQELESAHIAAHSFTNLSIADGSVNYLWAAHTGERIGKSEWSLPRKIIARNKITTPGGRLLSRHSSNMGTIMEFNDGQPRKVLVLDAQYREVKKWGTEGYDPTSLQNYDKISYLTSGAVMTDTEMNSNFSKAIDANTARQNCDTWMTRNSVTDTVGILGVPAVAHARSIVVDEKGCDVPNIQTLKRIFLEADSIDALDPTVAAHRGKALGNMNSNGFWRVLGGGSGAWVSTKYSGSWMHHIKPGGACGWMYKTDNLAVIPVLEL